MSPLDALVAPRFIQDQAFYKGNATPQHHFAK
jgi:hypothetical protein